MTSAERYKALRDKVENEVVEAVSRSVAATNEGPGAVTVLMIDALLQSAAAAGRSETAAYLTAMAEYFRLRDAKVDPKDSRVASVVSDAAAAAMQLHQAIDQRVQSDVRDLLRAAPRGMH